MTATVLSIMLLGIAPATPAVLTYDEPWHETVMREADALVRGRVLIADDGRFVLKLEKHVAGVDVEPVFTVDGCWRLRIMSLTSGFGPRLRLRRGTEYYLFLRWSSASRSWHVATPTAGVAGVFPAGVYATYRHSAHMALVAPDVYESTQRDMFLHLHGRTVDRKRIRRLFDRWLEKDPQGPADDAQSEQGRTFFGQHVALELFYYFGDGEQVGLLDGFLDHESGHVRSSAVRALSRVDSADSRDRLVKLIEAPGEGFPRVMAVRALRRLDARDRRAALERFLEHGEDAESGFGFRLMDDRIATRHPKSVKSAVRGLLQEWGG